MRSLTDKAIQFRTYPVVPRKRVSFDKSKALIQPLFESDSPIFKCLGGYFTHHTYNLLDFFVSRWLEIFNGKWRVMYGSNFSNKIGDQTIERLSEISPI